VPNASPHTSSEHIAWDALRAELYRFVSRRVPSADADDVVQEALLRIHRGLAKVRDERALVGWLYQVTRNALADHLRARRPNEALEAHDDHGDVDGAGGESLDPDGDDIAFRLLASCLAPLVAMLPEAYRAAIELVELHGVSQVDAAAQLGLPVSTMKSRVQRGRAQLREMIERCCAIAVDARGHVVEVTPRERCMCSMRSS
jgi:RNA polymerase sigma-70 factor, ECF subfamily